ncbi:penicillin-binding protein activator [Celerinatantimonas sp. YJH-8]|uniref:penicillin-binding protein activator n=1 Tax=Celerinatantimonas sp. YJH-8 TaxID=3228714 RepID=UPI0038C41392
MKKTFLRHSIYLALSLILLSACSSKSPAPTPVPEHPPLLTQFTQHPPADYLKQASMAHNDTRFDWQLLAAKAYLQGGQLNAGLQLLQELQPQAQKPYQQAGWQLVRAYASQLGQHPEQALQQLNFDSQWTLSDPYWKNYYQLRVDLETQLNRPIAAATDRVQLDPFLDSSQKAINQRTIWKLLKPIDSLQLRSYQQPGNELLNGYLELAAISNEPVATPQQLLAKLNQWQLSYPNHPAIQFIKGKLSGALKAPLYHPERIAVLLPLSGHFAQSGQMLRDGILAAYNDQVAQGQSIPQITFIDTMQNSMADIAAQLTTLKSEFIIGPLLKTNIEAFSQLKQPQPWLALNNINDGQIASDLMQPAAAVGSSEPTTTIEPHYSLSLEPETEAQQAAFELTKQGEHHPLLLLPDNELGRRIAKSFSVQWQSTHDDTPDITYYKNRDSLQDAVQQMLKTDQSQQRIRQMKQLLGQDLETEVRSRRDANAVYIIADNITSKLLIPFINVTISPFAEPLKIFGSSRTHQVGVSNQELNGMIISEIPWLLDHTSANAKRFQDLWPHASDSDKRLYALGYDAYHIMPTLAQMRGFSEYHIQGLTGILSVDADGQVQRQLVWSEYRDGQLEPIFEQTGD